MKQVTVKLFLVAISLFWIISCEDEATEPDSYNVSVCNSYFETIDTVKLDTIRFTALKPDSCTQAIVFDKGVYPVTIHTKSELLFKAKVTIQGSKPDLILRVSVNGNITAE